MTRRLRRGMTLFEVMISIGILMILAGVGWSSLEDAIEMGDVLSKGDITTRSARVAFDRMRRELQLAFLTQHKDNLEVYQTVFVGTDGDPDKAWFSTLAHKRLYKNTRECDQAEVSLWVDDAPRDMGPGDILYHRESARIDGLPDEDGRIWPLAYHVETFNLRYLNSATFEWVDDWDSRSADTPYQLPRAVQIGMVLKSEDPDDPKQSIDVPYVTTVELFYADPIAPKSAVDLINSGAGTDGGAR